MQLKQLTETHLLHDINAHSNPPRNMKTTIFHNHTNIIILEPDITPEECKENFKQIHIHNTSVPKKTNKLTTIKLYEIHLE